MKSISLIALIAALFGAARCCKNAGWEEYENFCYKVISDDVKGYNWDDARAKCKSLEDGGDLASVHSDAENKFIAGLIKKAGEKRGYWIGMKFVLGDDYGKKVVKSASWSDSSAMDFGDPSKLDKYSQKAPWLYGEPNLGGADSASGLCVLYIGLFERNKLDAEAWDDMDCSRQVYQTPEAEKIGAICKAPRHANYNQPKSRR